MSLTPFRDNDALVAHLRAAGVRMQTIAVAPDGSPVVAVRAGGDREPGVFISAGSHSTEQAGVRAAVDLATDLQTEHRVWIVPTRDPMGMNGYRHALQWASGNDVELAGRETLGPWLREHGEVLVDDGEELVIAILGEFGFTTRNLLGKLGAEHRQALEPLWGRRIFTPSGDAGMAGAAPLERAYTLIVAPDGEVLHINRFHDTAWAPGEVRATRRLLAREKPGLCFDLHESGGIGDNFWLSARHQPTPERDAEEARIATHVIGRIAEAGGTFMGDDYVPHAFFTRSEPGVFWLDASVRGEGLNLMDFCARTYGIAFGTEMGMFGSFEHRVHLGKTTVQAAVEAWSDGQ
jgi:hypothetical protein